MLGMAVGVLLGLLEGLLRSTWVGLWLRALDGSRLWSEGGAEELGAPDGTVLGVTLGALLGLLVGMQLPTFVGLWLGALVPDGSVLGLAVGALLGASEGFCCFPLSLGFSLAQSTVRGWVSRLERKCSGILMVPY